MMWLLCILWPMMVSLGVLRIHPSGRLASLLLASAPLPALVVALGLIPHEGTTFPWLLLGAHFGLDAVRGPILAATALLWLLAGWSCGYYPLREEGRTQFQVFFLFTLAGNIGLLISADIITFYSCFALMTFAAAGMIIHAGDAAAHRAAKVYLVLAVFGEVLLLAAIFLTVAEAGSLRLEGLAGAVADSGHRDWIVGLTLAGFGVKLGWVPFHFWLPLAHPVAPTPASAVLSGAMIKAGLIGWLHLLPLGVLEMPVWGHLLMTMGVTAALGGAAIGLAQRNPKVILAYSSISQMGLVSIFIGLTLLRPSLWVLTAPALTLFVVHHALAKGSLFLGTATPRGTGVSRIAFLIGLALPALVLAGAPATSGMVVKAHLKELTEGSGEPWSSLLPEVLFLSSFATALLLGRFLWLIRNQSPAGKTTPYGWWAPWIVSVMASGGLILFLARQSLFHLPAPLIDPKNLPSELIPLVAAVTALWIWFGWGQRRWSGFAIPPGDLLYLCLLPQAGVRRRWRQLEQSEREMLNIATLSDRILALEEGREWVKRLERYLGRWPWIGLLAGLGLIAFFLALK